MSKKYVNGYGAAADEIGERMRDMPKAVWDGNEGRMVPIAYDVEIVPLVTHDEYRAREYQAAEALTRKERSARMEQAARGAFNRYSNAMASEDGISIAFMTRSERALASEEWGKRLRDLVEAGKRRDEERERSRVLVDIDWID